MEPKTFNIGNLLETLRNDGAQQAAAVMGVKLDYTYECLEKIEKAILIMFNGKKEIQPASSWFLGFMLGETIVRNIPGAEWTNLESADPSDMTIKYPLKGIDATGQCKPVVRIIKFIDNDEDRLTSLYFLLEMQSRYSIEEMLSVGKPHGDGWYEFIKNGESHIFRIVKSKELAVDKKKITMQDRPIVLDEDGKIKEVNMESTFTPAEAAKRVPNN